MTTPTTVLRRSPANGTFVEPSSYDRLCKEGRTRVHTRCWLPGRVCPSRSRRTNYWRRFGRCSTIRRWFDLAADRGSLLFETFWESILEFAGEILTADEVMSCFELLRHT
jgi:hypothetical protein